jgi:hypothetical protein
VVGVRGSAIGAGYAFVGESAVGALTINNGQFHIAADTSAGIGTGAADMMRESAIPALEIADSVFDIVSLARPPTITN